MSETNQYVEITETKEKYIPGAGNIRFYLNEFSGTLKGLSYHDIQFVNPVGDEATDDERNVGANTALSEAVAKYGAEIVLNGLNSYLKSNIRAKVVNSKVPKVDDTEEQKKIIAGLVQVTPVIFTSEDANNFKPGERELSFAGMMKQAVVAQKNGDNEACMRWMQKAMEFNAKQAELAAEVARS